MWFRDHCYMRLPDCYISSRQHRWMAAAAAATGKSCGRACAPDKQQQEKQRPPFPLAASDSASGSPGRVAHSSGSAWPCRGRYPSKRLSSPHPRIPPSKCSGSKCWIGPGRWQAFAAWWEGLQRMTTDREARVGCCHGSHILIWEGSETEREGGGRRSSLWKVNESVWPDSLLRGGILITMQEDIPGSNGVEFPVPVRIAGKWRSPIWSAVTSAVEGFPPPDVTPLPTSTAQWNKIRR